MRRQSRSIVDELQRLLRIGLCGPTGPGRRQRHRCEAAGNAPFSQPWGDRDDERADRVRQSTRRNQGHRRANRRRAGRGGDGSHGCRRRAGSRSVARRRMHSRQRRVHRAAGSRRRSTTAGATPVTLAERPVWLFSSGPLRSSGRGKGGGDGRADGTRARAGRGTRQRRPAEGRGAGRHDQSSRPRPSSSVPTTRTSRRSPCRSVSCA